MYEGVQMYGAYRHMGDVLEHTDIKRVYRCMGKSTNVQGHKNVWGVTDVWWIVQMGGRHTDIWWHVWGHPDV